LAKQTDSNRNGFIIYGGDKNINSKSQYLHQGARWAIVDGDALYIFIFADEGS
jgi:hypothetical protein